MAMHIKQQKVKQLLNDNHKTHALGYTFISGN